MNKNWPTEVQDMQIARAVIEEYVVENEIDSVGLFEMSVNLKDRSLDFRLSDWVVDLASHFKSLYGVEQGDLVTRYVLTKCLTMGHTIH